MGDVMKAFELIVLGIAAGALATGHPMAAFFIAVFGAVVTIEDEILNWKYAEVDMDDYRDD